MLAQAEGLGNQCQKDFEKPQGGDLTRNITMPQSLAKILLHSTFSTKGRVPLLQDKSIRNELYAYMATVLQSIGCPALIIDGVPDHIHILNRLSRTITVAEMFEKIKSSSSGWIKSKGPKFRDFYWQSGYGAFSVSESRVPDVRKYIENQKEHHRRLSFQDEFRALCERHGIAIDERYVWD